MSLDSAVFADFCESLDAPLLWLAEPDWRVVAGNAAARRLLVDADGAWPSPGRLATEPADPPTGDTPLSRAQLVWTIVQVRAAAGRIDRDLLANVAPHFGVRRFEADGTAGVMLFGRPEAVRAHGYVARAATEEEYRLMFEHANEGIATVALDGTFLRVNARLATLVGRPANEIVGRSVASFHHPTNTGSFAESASEISRFGHARFERVFARPDGSPVHLLISSALLRDGADEPLRYVAMYSDVSELRAAEAESRQSQQLAVIGRFAGGIAHDINNLLAGILGYAELIRMEIGDVPAREYCDRLIDTTLRAGDFASGLLSFARVGETRHELFDVSDVVREVVHFLDHVTPPRIAVHVTMAPGPWLLVGDPSQIHAALVNLGLNAAEAIERVGRVTFSVAGSDDGSCVRISVADTGVGIGPEELERVFEPFFTTKHTARGTGLGLMSVQSAAVRFGGEVTVASVPGEGSEFALLLPSASADEACVPDTAPPDSARAARALVVDDEEAVRFVVASALRRQGCDVIEAADGAAALALLGAAAETPDLMVFDLRMPAMSGSELFREVRARWPDVACVLMTGFSAGEEADELYGAGVDALLQKPFTAQALADTVADVLARR